MAAKSKKTTVDRLQSTARKLSVDSYSVAGVKKGSFDLPEALFGQKPNKVLLAQAVRVFLSNQRSARAMTKTRGQIQGSTHKIYRQKGTGGARHGSRMAPLFVGGGIAHGPRGIENYKLQMSRVLRKKALVSALSARALAGQVTVCDIDGVEPKTKVVAQTLVKMSLKKPLTLVHAGKNELMRAARNLADVNLVSAKEISAYHALLGNSLVVTPEAVNILETKYKRETK